MRFSAVIFLIIANVAVFLLQNLSQEVLEGLFALWPLRPIDPRWHFQIWQIVTYAFLHDTHNMAHLVFNMLGLWVFGTGIEQYVGPRRLLPAYSDLDGGANRFGSNYHALQAILTKRMSNGLQFSVNYGWSHFLDDGDS